MGIWSPDKSQVADIKSVTDNLPDSGVLSSLAQAAAVGDVSDYVGVPFVANANTVLAYLQTGYYHVHGASFIYPDKAVPVQLTAAAPSW